MPVRPAIIGQQGAEVRLARQIGGQHVADEQGLWAQAARVFDGGVDGMVGQVAQTHVPVFANGCLAEASDNNVCHDTPLIVMASAPNHIDAQHFPGSCGRR